MSKKDKKPLGKAEKEWFNNDCKLARQKFRRQKRHNKKYKNEQTKHEMKKAELEYKKSLDRALVIHRRKMSNKLKSLKSSNAKEYWMLLKRRTKKEQPNITFEKLFDYFKTLNSAQNSDESIISPSLNPEDVNRLNEHINYAITKDEISRCIKK